MPTADSPSTRVEALGGLVAAVAANIPHVDFASITVNRDGAPLRTLAATDPLALRLDEVQYELVEGPCYAAVTDDRLVLVNDLAESPEFPRYGPRAAELGVRAQLAIQLINDDERAGLNLYCTRPGAFDTATVQLAEMFATQAAVLLEYAGQVEQLSEALHTRTDIGIAVGIVMERYKVDRDGAFAFLVRGSNNSNRKLRQIAIDIIEGYSDPDQH